MRLRWFGHHVFVLHDQRAPKEIVSAVVLQHPQAFHDMGGVAQRARENVGVVVIQLVYIPSARARIQSVAPLKKQ
jgi:FtsZ-interacting cell division protein YlmF